METTGRLSGAKRNRYKSKEWLCVLTSTRFSELRDFVKLHVVRAYWQTFGTNNPNQTNFSLSGVVSALDGSARLMILAFSLDFRCRRSSKHVACVRSDRHQPEAHPANLLPTERVQSLRDEDFACPFCKLEAAEEQRFPSAR